MYTVGASTHAPKVPLLLRFQKEVLCGTVTAHTVPSTRCTIIFSCYVTIAMRYTKGVHRYGDIAAVPRFLPINAMSP